MVLGLVRALSRRLPLGWKQLKHDRTRLLAAIAGITFADILIFMQLGFQEALYTTNTQYPRRLDADVVLLSAQANNLNDGNNNRASQQNRNQDSGPSSDEMNLKMLRGSVPGNPGEDYPIYAEVPDTSFNCEGRIFGGKIDKLSICKLFCKVSFMKVTTLMLRPGAKLSTSVEGEVGGAGHSSAQTGQFSTMRNGKVYNNLSAQELRKRINEYLKERDSLSKKELSSTKEGPPKKDAPVVEKTVVKS